MKMTKMLEEELYKKPEPVKVGNKYIGGNNGNYFIAEIGINHNGSMDLCKKLIDIAVEKGCDAVKFQKRTLDLVYTQEELAKPRDIPKDIILNGINRNIFSIEEINRMIKEEKTTNGDQKRILEFGEKEYNEIAKYCKEKGIDWFASPWDEESVDFLEKYNIPCYKIASALLTDKGLLKKVKEKGKPIILSTGMSTMEQIKKAVSYLGEENLVLLHCTSTYPSKDEELDLNVIKTLKRDFNCPIGYSGHEPGIWPTLVAASIGAVVFERHITLDRALYGSDQAASLDPTNLGHICRAVKRTQTMLGSYEKKVHDSEKEIIKKIRKKIDF